MSNDKFLLVCGWNVGVFLVVCKDWPQVHGIITSLMETPSLLFLTQYSLADLRLRFCFSLLIGRQTSHFQCRYNTSRGPHSSRFLHNLGLPLSIVEHLCMDAIRKAKSAMSNFVLNILIIGWKYITYSHQELISNTSHCEVIREERMIREQYLVVGWVVWPLYTKAAARQKIRKGSQKNIGTRTPTTLLLPLLEPLSFLFIQHQSPSSSIFINIASSSHLHFVLSFFLDSRYKLVASFPPL